MLVQILSNFGPLNEKIFIALSPLLEIMLVGWLASVLCVDWVGRGELEPYPHPTRPTPPTPLAPPFPPSALYWIPTAALSD